MGAAGGVTSTCQIVTVWSLAGVPDVCAARDTSRDTSSKSKTWARILGIQPLQIDVGLAGVMDRYAGGLIPRADNSVPCSDQGVGEGAGIVGGRGRLTPLAALTSLASLTSLAALTSLTSPRSTLDRPPKIESVKCAVSNRGSVAQELFHCTYRLHEPRRASNRGGGQSHGDRNWRARKVTNQRPEMPASPSVTETAAGRPVGGISAGLGGAAPSPRDY